LKLRTDERPFSKTVTFRYRSNTLDQVCQALSRKINDFAHHHRETCVHRVEVRLSTQLATQRVRGNHLLAAEQAEEAGTAHADAICSERSRVWRQYQDNSLHLEFPDRSLPSLPSRGCVDYGTEVPASRSLVQNVVVKTSIQGIAPPA
jgi:hypothetical protein